MMANTTHGNGGLNITVNLLSYEGKFQRKASQQLEGIHKGSHLHILFAIIFVMISVGLLVIIPSLYLRFYKLVKDDHVLAYLAVLLGSMLLLYAYVSEKFLRETIDPKPKTKFEQYLEEDQPVTQILWVAHIISCLAPNLYGKIWSR